MQKKEGDLQSGFTSLRRRRRALGVTNREVGVEVGTKKCPQEKGL